MPPLLGCLPSQYTPLEHLRAGRRENLPLAEVEQPASAYDSVVAMLQSWLVGLRLGMPGRLGMWQGLHNACKTAHSAQQHNDWHRRRCPCPYLRGCLGGCGEPADEEARTSGS